MRVYRTMAMTAVLVAACSPRPAARDMAASERQVRAAMDEYGRRLRAFTPDTLSALFASNGHMYEPGIHVAGRDSIRGFMRSFAGVKIDSAVIDVDTVEVYDSTAYLWGTFRESYTMPGQPMTNESGRFIVRYVQEATGAWMIQRFMVQPAPAPAPAPATPARRS